MARILVVPVSLDALCVRAPTRAIEAEADFSRLPFCNGVRDVNAGKPFLSESIASRPFANVNLELGAGVHLHWSLPPFLARARQVDGRAVFPRVPNRWLVTRTLGKEVKQWVVESDYVHPRDENHEAEAVTFPIIEGLGALRRPEEAVGGHEQPFRYLGRKVPLDEWREDDPAAQYLERLTVNGYGEPTFAAFYPNCRSVFGFWDDDRSVLAGRGPRSDLAYEVVGWYAQPAEDPLQQRGGEVSAKALADELRCRVPEGAPPAQRLYCLARLSFDAPPTGEAPPGEATEEPLDAAHLLEGPLGHPVHAADDVAVSFGNTGSEALSAFLARRIAADQETEDHAAHEARIEEQLESILLAPGLSHRRLDRAPKVAEARHEKGFVAVPGGSEWRIRPEGPAAPADSNEARPATRVSLPPELADALHEVNRLQREQDREDFEHASLQVELYAEWSKYLLTAYPPRGTRDQYPDIDRVKARLETRSLHAVRERRLRVDALAGEARAAREGLAAGLEQHNVDSLVLTRACVRDFPALIGFLAAGKGQGPRKLARLLRGRLSNDTRDRVDQGGPKGEKRRAVLLEEVNRALADPELVRAQDLAGLGVPAHLLSLWEESPPAGSSAARLRNRALLELALPEALCVAPKSLFVLKRSNGPRYWKPRDPAVMLAGSALRPTERHGGKGFLPCDVVTVPEELDSHALLASLREELGERIEAAGPSIEAATSVWSHQPWNPLFLEWSAEHFPVAHMRDLPPREGIDLTERGPDPELDADYVTSHYVLPDDGVELLPRGGSLPTSSVDSVFSGRSILIPHALEMHRRSLLEYLKKTAKVPAGDDGRLRRLLDVVRFEHEGTPEEALDDPAAWTLLRAAYRAFREGLEAERSPADERNDPIATALEALLVLRETDALSQCLGGFTDALMMHERTLGLPVRDPIGFDEYRDFAAAVRAAVGPHTTRAAQPFLEHFHPIRDGEVKLVGMRLIDTFGQFKDVPAGAETVQAMPLRGTAKGHARLPLRLAQPARLDFRWLSGAREDAEMNSHPASSPICGWIVPNNLDGGLMVFDHAGRALGTIDSSVRWRVPPGDGELRPAEQLPNPYLRRVVLYLLHRDERFLEAFRATLESALENIDPEDFAQHQHLALLMGRPIAVVRASLRLELKGLPGTDQSWGAFLGHLDDGVRSDAGFPQVRFPIRLGEYRQLNDGLVGYWKETEGVFENDVFYAPESDDAGHPLIRSHGQDPTHLLQSIEAPAETVTLLVDPRCAVHATSGLLPTKDIRIPADQFADSLRDMHFSFLTSPLLTERDAVQVPLSEEEGFEWSWIERTAERWVEVPNTDLQDPDAHASFSAPTGIREGWLRLTPKDPEPDEAPEEVL
ncbi:MAG: hypothetical protein AAF682_20685 [Planctomycetota bacterium]